MVIWFDLQISSTYRNFNGNLDDKSQPNSNRINGNDRHQRDIKDIDFLWKWMDGKWISQNMFRVDLGNTKQAWANWKVSEWDGKRGRERAKWGKGKDRGRISWKLCIEEVFLSILWLHELSSARHLSYHLVCKPFVWHFGWKVPETKYIAYIRHVLAWMFGINFQCNERWRKSEKWLIVIIHRTSWYTQIEGDLYMRLVATLNHRDIHTHARHLIFSPMLCTIASVWQAREE